MIKIITLVAISFIIGVSFSHTEAKSRLDITVNSIVSHPDGIFISITDNSTGKTSIVSAAQAKANISRVCPSLHFKPGVLGDI